MIVNIDGQFVAKENASIPISDGSFLYGDTLFETMAIREGRILFLNEHLARLKCSAHWCHFPFPGRALAQALEATRLKLGDKSARIRLTLSRGDYDGPIRSTPEQVRFIITAKELTSDFSSERDTGVSCIAARNQRVNALAPLPQTKRGNYQDCLYALHHARTHNAFEALFVSPEGHLLEGATSNLFIVLDGTLITPPLGKLVLAGIMRAQVLRAAADLKLIWREDLIEVADLLSAEEVFITNSLIELLPVSAWEGQSLTRGSLHLDLMKKISDYT